VHLENMTRNKELIKDKEIAMKKMLFQMSILCQGRISKPTMSLVPFLGKQALALTVKKSGLA
jgi:hypothetical protein